MMRKHRRCFLFGGVILFICVITYFPILLSIQPEELGFWNITRDLAVFIQPQNYSVIIDAVETCQSQGIPKSGGDGNINSNGDGIFLLVIVCSAVNNFEARMAIRETWGDPQALMALPRFWPPPKHAKSHKDAVKQGTLNSTQTQAENGTSVHALETQTDDVLNHSLVINGSSFVQNGTAASVVRLIFMLGRTDDKQVQQFVEDERTLHGDIVQEDFLDTYNNLTLKSVMMLKWVNSTCRQAQFVMKTDDDTFVNVPRLVTYLRKRGHSNMLLGCLICRAVPVKNRKSKWYAPRSLYNERFYPNYLSGTGYILSGDMVSRLYEMALLTPFFHLEDIFITGICARQLDAKPIDYEGFSYQKRPLNPCLYHFVITGHKVSANDTRTIWRKMHVKDLYCDKSNLRLRDYKPSHCS